MRLALAASACLALATLQPAWGQGSSGRTSLAERIAPCLACHGEDGNSRLPGVPSLAGQPAFFVMNQLFLMREGVRRVEAMGDLAKGLRDDELQSIAAYFAALPARASDEPVDANRAARGAQIAQAKRCASCHLPTLAGQEQMPRVARQRIDYLLPTLQAYRDNRRSGADTAMTAVIVGMSDEDLLALAHFAATK